ncbi:MAG: proton-conducting membrane transporter [Clostridiales bacterium]|jgi:multicomponent Na+:H+ antiporter subunit D|nr:proton-conducting membrane transporter [Clostridiales bacterium]
MNILLVLPILLPILAGAILPKLKGVNLKTFVTAVMAINTALVVLIVSLGDISIRLLSITPQLSLFLQVDNLSRFFILLAAGLWLLVTFYTFGYIKADDRQAGFYRYYLLSYGVIIGATLSGNLVTLYLFYEFMTLFTYPLVTYNGDKAAIKAGNKVLVYSFFGAGLTLAAMFFAARFGMTFDFVAGGTLDMAAVAGSESLALFLFFVAFIGFGVKAYIFPLFDWVPSAYPEVPSPAAALFSGVVSKVAILAILRLTLYVFGADFIMGTWVQNVLLVLTITTVFLGSMSAFREKLFKRRLAYSSVSQLSYIMFGIVLLSPVALLGSMLHVVAHGVIKVVLFLAAGAMIQQTGKTMVDDFKGAGKSMPITLWCFTLGSIALIGIPPTLGFLSKWYLAVGGLATTAPALGMLGAGMLLISALLTGGYLIPIFAGAFFPGYKFDYTKLVKNEPKKFITIPLIILAALALLFGIFPGILMNFIDSISAMLF